MKRIFFILVLLFSFCVVFSMQSSEIPDSDTEEDAVINTQQNEDIPDLIENPSGGDDDLLRKAILEYYEFDKIATKFKAPALQRFLLERAVLIYGEAAKRHASHKRAPSAYYLIGEIHRASGNKRASMAAYSTVTEDFLVNEYSDFAQYRIAELYYDDGSYENAQQNFFLLIDSYPRSELIPQAYLMAGRCYHELMNYTRSIRTYKKIIEVFPEPEIKRDAMAGISEAYYASGNLDEAQEAFKDIITAFPDTSEADRARFMLAKVFSARDNYNSARKVLREITSSYGVNDYIDDAAYEVALTYYLEEKYAHAIQNYTNAMVRYPEYKGYDDALENVADSYRRLFLYRDALMKYEELLENQKSAVLDSTTETQLAGLKKRICKTLITIGEIYHSQGDYENALGNFYEAHAFLSSDQDENSLNFSIAESYYGLGWYREAVELYDKLAPMKIESTEDIILVSHLADSYEKLGYLQNAREHYLMVVHSNPGESDADALRMISNAVFRVGEIYAEQGLIREEGEFYESILAEKREFLESRDEARLLYQLGMIYEKTDNRNGAIAMYKSVMDEYKETDWYELARLNVEILTISQRTEGKP